MPAIIGLAVCTLAVFAVGFISLFDGPGYEIALAAGLIVPSGVAISSALEISAALSRSRADKTTSVAPFDMVSRGLAIGAVFGFVAYTTTLIHGLRVGFCDAWSGTVTFALGPFCGALVAGVWSVIPAEVASRMSTPRRRRVIAVLLAFLGPLVSAGVSLGRFFSSPMVFAYDPFAGFFSGTLYDTVIDSSGLLSYRAGTLTTLGAAGILAFHLGRNEQGGLRWNWQGRWGVALAGALCALASATHLLSGTTLGHYQTSDSIAAALGGRTEGDRCTVLHPRGMRRDEVHRFVADCDAHVRDVEAWFEGKGPDRITVYLFANVGQKAALMGAAETQIAKPWRSEIYVQNMPYPHPVVGHELAHVIAGSFARGPFKTAGQWAGFLPNPGLIEGVAVAASPREGDLSPLEWAKAMKDLGLLPKLQGLFGLGFLGAHAGVAYTVSGAFVEYIKSTSGAGAIKAWYAGGSLPEITGRSWADLEASFLNSLDAIELSDAARAQAKARFDRPGIFGRRCPHVVDACRRKAEAAKDQGDEDGVMEQMTRIAALDPNDPMVRVSMARSQVRRGQIAEGKAALKTLADDERLPRHVRDRALEDLADLELAPSGDGALAAGAYRDLMTRTTDEDTLRTLEVKAASISKPAARAAMYYFLVGEPGRGPDRVRASELFGRWLRDAPDDGMPDYLMARQLHGGGLFEEAAERLDTALSKKLEPPRVSVEALRLRIIAACALADPVKARRVYDAYSGRSDVPRARREAMNALVGRCARDVVPAPDSK
ncbi:MAG: hypothetical protein IPK82_30975 [Polyangiaceae bacterium]|nr:hypothetical protein [Polyangiaceae bacterium]